MDYYDRYLKLKHVIKRYKIKNMYIQKSQELKKGKVSIKDPSLLVIMEPIPIRRPKRAYLEIQYLFLLKEQKKLLFYVIMLLWE